MSWVEDQHAPRPLPSQLIEGSGRACARLEELMEENIQIPHAGRGVTPLPSLPRGGSSLPSWALSGRVGTLLQDLLELVTQILEISHSVSMPLSPGAWQDFPHAYQGYRVLSPAMRTLRVLVAKPGLDSHDRGARVVAAALRDAGMEVIYTGLHQTPEMIAEAALQEDVDVVALSVLSGAHMTLFPRVRALLEKQGQGEVLLTGGGIVPEEDAAALGAKGVGRLFTPGASTQDIIRYIQEEVAARRAKGKPGKAKRR